MLNADQNTENSEYGNFLRSVGFSHLRKHTFRPGFKDIKSTFPVVLKLKPKRYFLHYHFCNSNRATLVNDFENILIPFSTVSDNSLISLLLYGVCSMIQKSKNGNVNYKIDRGLINNFSDNLPTC